MAFDKVYVPPIKIQGIKTKLVPLIASSANICRNTTWIEPFMGSGVVGLNVAKHHAIFADTNPHIINFYKQLQNGKITSVVVRQFLEEHGAQLAQQGEAYYYFVRERFNKKHCPLDFLFLNRCCFNGMVRFNRSGKFNVPFGHKPERFAKAYVTKIANQVKYFEQKFSMNNWIFLCQSFEETISMADDNSFIYCDPPYIGRHVDYYDSWDEEKEKLLHETLIGSGARYMLSTWDCNQYRENPYVDSIWGHCQKTVKEHFYFVGAKETNRSSVIEALLTNYEVFVKDDNVNVKTEQLELVF